MQIKTTMLCHLTTARTAIIKKFTNSKSWRGCRVGEPSYTVGENINWSSYCGERHKGFLKINMFWGVLSRWKRNETKASTPSQPLHKYITNTSACGTTPTEHLLKMAGDHRPPQRQAHLRRISMWVSWVFLSFQCCFHLSWGFFLSILFLFVWLPCVFLFFLLFLYLFLSFSLLPSVACGVRMLQKGVRSETLR